MTVRTLIAELSKFDSELEVGGVDDMGYLLEIYNVSKYPSFVALDISRTGWFEDQES